MKKRIVFVSIVLLLTAIIPTVLAFLLPSNPTQYYNAYILKQERWNKIDSPRLMIAGFSELAFGVDSKMIQDTTGYNVVNWALHAGLGADIMCKDVKKNAKKGDVVVFAFPLDMTSDGTADIQSLAFLIDLCPDKLNELSYGNYIKFIKGIYPLLKGKILYNVSCLLGKEIVDDEYNSKNFNMFGDEVAHWEKKSPGGEPLRVHCAPLEEFNEELYENIIETISYLKCIGVSVIIIPQLLERCNYEPNKEMILYLEKRLNESGYKYAISPNDFLLESDMSYYGVHANKKGVEFVSRAIINAVKTAEGL